jgi:mono/diheme cytochrome c family protein
MKDKHRVSLKSPAKEILNLSKHLVLVMGLMFLVLSARVVKAEQPAIIDPCTVFPPQFPSYAPDSFLQFLELQVPSSTATAEAYYEAVDPFDRRTTLNDWLVLNGFIQNPGDLQPGPVGDALVQRDAFAMYINNVDLGVTRRFYSLTKPNGNVAIYTENYRCLSDAKLRQNLLATVAMEYSPADDGSNPKVKFVTFYAYGGDNQRILEIDLDGKGAKALPDNCQICHGGNPRTLDVNGNYPNHGNIGASFLPWDIEAFIFDTDDPALSRAAQEGEIKKLNQAALATYKKTAKFDEVGGYSRPNAMVELVRGWYGGATLPNPTFNENFTPKGWLPPYAPPEAEALYHDVIVPTCRSCHVSREAALDFASYKGFMTFRDATENLVFNSISNPESGGGGNEGGVMPLALQTFNNFWNTPAHDVLRQYLDTH